MTAVVRGFQLNGWHVLAGMVAFFAVIFTVDIGMAVIAYRSHPGEVSAKPFEEGVAFNQTLARRSEERALGWRAGVEASSLGVGQLRVRVSVTDAAGAPVKGLVLTGAFERPATERGRLDRPFTETRAGIYDTAIPDVPGAWDVSLKARDGQGRPFDARVRLTWR